MSPQKPRTDRVGHEGGSGSKILTAENEKWGRSALCFSPRKGCSADIYMNYGTKKDFEGYAKEDKGPSGDRTISDAGCRMGARLGILAVFRDRAHRL